MTQEQSSGWELDDILTKVQFGPYQHKVVLLLSIMMIYSNINPLSFALTATDLNYRCRIPECENNDSTSLSYMPKWIRNAIPFHDGEPYKCKRFKPRNHNVSTFKENANSCEADEFDTSKTEECNNWVFETEEITIVKSFDVMCENNKYQLSLIGTLNSLGQFFGIPFFGILSDKYGRKFIAILCTVVSAVLGIFKALSWNYVTFATFEFSESFFGSAIYGAIFTLLMEFVNAEKRGITAMILAFFYPVGAMILGVAAWYFQDWRKVLLICYSPGLLFIFYIWMIPESMRWLLTHGQQSEAVKILQTISKTNKVELPNVVLAPKLTTEEKTFSLRRSIKEAMRSKSILLRLLNCTFSWFACTMVYYGLIMHSVDLAGNKYLNFILSNAAEIPAVIAGGFIVKHIKRRISVCVTFILSGICCIAGEFIPAEMLLLKLSVYLLSNCTITIVFYIIYIYSAEMFPTELRLSFCGFVSMVGRIGSMLAPQIILMRYTVGKHVPLVTFGVTVIIAGAFATLFPETFNKELPDTIEEAEKIDVHRSD